MARGWFGDKEAHSRAAKKGWANRRQKQKKMYKVGDPVPDPGYSPRAYHAYEQIALKPAGQGLTGIALLRNQIKETEKDIVTLSKKRDNISKMRLKFKRQSLADAKKELAKAEANANR